MWISKTIPGAQPRPSSTRNAIGTVIKLEPLYESPSSAYQRLSTPQSSSALAANSTNTRPPCPVCGCLSSTHRMVCTYATKCLMSVHRFLRMCEADTREMLVIRLSLSVSLCVCGLADTVVKERVVSSLSRQKHFSRNIRRTRSGHPRAAHKGETARGGARMWGAVRAERHYSAGD